MMNIPRDVDDPFYRYKMPVPSVEQKRKQTVVQNLGAIAKALDRPETYISKYFECNFHAPVKGNGVSAIITANGIMETLDGFIASYVLCGNCRNPETVVRINKKDELRLKCKACGHRTAVVGNDKVNKYIVNA